MIQLVDVFMIKSVSPENGNFNSINQCWLQKLYLILWQSFNPFLDMFHFYPFFSKSWFCCSTYSRCPYPQDPMRPGRTTKVRRRRRKRCDRGGFQGDGGGHVLPMIFWGLKCGKRIWHWLITVIYCDLHKLCFFFCLMNFQMRIYNAMICNLFACIIWPKSFQLDS